MKKKILMPILIICIAAGSTAAMVLQKRDPEKTEVEETTVLVETIALRNQDITFSVTSQGNVTPHTETTLVSEVSSVVLEVAPAFVSGGFFKHGEVLLRLDPADYELAVDQAQANLLTMRARLAQEEARVEQAKKEWDLSGRARSEAPSVALRTPFLEEARANLLYAEADLKKAQRKLHLTTIRAPYDGMVKDKHVDIGQYVTTGTQLATTFAVDFAEVRLPLTDQDIAFLDLPAPVAHVPANETSGPEVVLTATIGGRDCLWSAHIVRTEGVVDQRTRVYYAVARIADPYGLEAATDRPSLPIGSFVKASIEGRMMRNIVPVPLEAIRGMNQVLVVDPEDRLRIKQVEIIRTDQNYAYVSDGLADGQQAIITAVYNPIDGMKVSRSVD